MSARITVKKNLTFLYLDHATTVSMPLFSSEILQKSKMNSIIAIIVAGLMYASSIESGFSQSKKTIDPLEIEVLRHIIMNDTIPTVLFRTTITEMSQPLARHLFYLTDFDICSSLVNPDSTKLDKEERDYIVDRFTTMEVMNINKLIKNPKNYTVKKLEGHNWFVISMPVVFREGEYAIYYSKSEYSGQFVLMKKIGGSWIDVCYSSVYVE